jgi:hypothetical protein
MHLTTVGAARLCAPQPLRTHDAAAITPAFLAAVEGALRRADRLGLNELPLLALQNAPRGFDPDVEALAPSSHSRRAALRLWQLPRDALTRTVCINVLREDVGTRAGVAELAQARLAAALQRLEGRVSALLACGWVGRRCRPGFSWTTTIQAVRSPPSSAQPHRCTVAADCASQM